MRAIVLERPGPRWILRRAVPGIAAALFLAGCVASRPDRNASDVAVFFPFIKDGRTTKEEAVLQLGEPSTHFENERILTYRLCDDERGGLAVAGRRGMGGWETAQYSLVLVFDDRRLLKNHNLVRVR